MKSNQIEDQYHNLEIIHQLRMIEVSMNTGEFKKAGYHLTNIGRFKLTHCVQEIKDINSFMNKESYYEVLRMIPIVLEKLTLIVFDFKCDKAWNNLILTGDEKMRYCQSCTKNVYRVDDVIDLKKQIELGNCIFYLGVVETPSSCQLSNHDGPDPFKIRYNNGPMGTPNYYMNPNK